MSKITKETAKNILLDAFYFVGLILLASVVVLLAVGVISWAIRWRTLPQYADMLLYVGVITIFVSFFMFKGDSAQTQNLHSRRRREGRYYIPEEPAKYETINKIMGQDGFTSVAFFVIVGALMIASNALIYTYLVN
jgi:hypothetical protein